jgi:hypothetical protein
MACNVLGEVAGRGAVITMTPTITAGSYSAGFVIGGPITFAGALLLSRAPDAAVPYQGILQSLAISFKGSTQTSELDFCLFNTSPSNGTYADHATPTWNAADDQYFLGAYALTSVLSPLGTHSMYNLDGIGKQIVGASTSLFGLVVCKAALAASPASVADMTVRLGMIW